MWLLHGQSTNRAQITTPKVTVKLLPAGSRFKKGCGATPRTACVLKAGTPLRFVTTVAGARPASQPIGAQVVLGTSDPEFGWFSTNYIIDRDIRFTLPGNSRTIRRTLTARVSRLDASANTNWAVRVTTAAAGNYRPAASNRIYVLFQ